MNYERNGKTYEITPVSPMAYECKIDGAVIATGSIIRAPKHNYGAEYTWMVGHKLLITDEQKAVCEHEQREYLTNLRAWRKPYEAGIKAVETAREQDARNRAAIYRSCATVTKTVDVKAVEAANPEAVALILIEDWATAVNSDKAACGRTAIERVKAGVMPTDSAAQMKNEYAAICEDSASRD